MTQNLPSPPQAIGVGEGSDPRIGATFGKYTIGHLLGQGGMGAVYEGTDVGLKRRVAVKFLPDEVLKKPDVVERFMREAQVAARLSHANIIAVYDVGHDERGCYMVMELLQAKSASSRIKSKGPYPWPVATRIIADCCMALKVAHEAGVVHRDIKPDNILFSPTGVVKLVDFGLVKLMEDDLHLTQSGMLCGTPMYMSPEQATNQGTDPRSDLYSLGITFYALLTGKPPFGGIGIPQILLSHLKDPTPDPRQEVPDIPEAVVAILMRATEKDRAVRYQSATEMSEALEAILVAVPQRNLSVFSMEDSYVSGPGLPMTPSMMAAIQGSLKNSSAAGVAPGNASALQRQAAQKDLETSRVETKPSRRGFLAVSGAGILGMMAGGVYLLRKRDTQGGGTEGLPTTQKGPEKPLSSEPLKIGVLHSLTGSLAVSERPLADAALLAIEELNAKGGVLGRRLEPITLDGKSEVTADSAYTRGAQRLLEEDKVSVVFGGYGSAARKLCVPFFEQRNRLLFYPSPYEGLEESASVIYTGSTPNQLGIPALKWCVEALRAKRFFFVGTDGLRAHAIGAIVGDNAKRVGIELVGTHFALVGESEFAPVVKKIRDSNADVVLSMLVGDSTVSFFRALADAGILPRVLPVVSLSLGENELGQMGELAAAGNYVARTRFPWSDAAGGDGFGTRFKKKYGAHRPISESMESAYLGVHLWAAAVEKAGTDETEKVRQALKSQELVVMGAKVRIDASNQHAWKVFQMGKITNDNTIENVKTETEALPPIPFPPPRTRGEWEQFSRALYETWDHNWANPHKPASLGGKPIKEKKRRKKK